MATFQRRGDAWRVQVRLRGVAKSATFDTHEEAKAWATTTEAKLLSQPKVEASAAGFATVSSLFDRYAREVSVLKRSARWERIKLAVLGKEEDFAVAIRDFTPAALAAWRDRRLTQVSPGSVNRELNIIGAVFTHALKEWRIPGVTGSPVSAIKRPPQPKARKRRVSDEELALISERLGWGGTKPPTNTSQWVAWVMYFAVETAMRRGEILGMTWGDVFLPKLYIQLRDGRTKNGFGRQVPLSEKAADLLKMLTRGRDVDAVVWASAGSADTLFRRAVRAAGLKDLHFHDTRREATTRIAPAMGDPLTLGRVTGHRDLRSLWAYYEPTGTDLAMKLRAKKP